MDLYFLHEPTEDNLEASAYYWWFRFLQLLQKQKQYGREHPLWKEFGDASEKTSFWDWWDDHYLLFMSGQLGVHEVETAEDIEQARKEGAFLVRIDPGCTRDYLRSVFEDILDEKGIGITPGRRKHQHEVMNAKRPFERRPDVRSLKKSFEALELRLKDPQQTLYEVGKELKLNPSAVYKDRDLKSEKSAQKNRMNATVGRYLKWGKSILAGVAEGKFPVM
jgi:hypothetical protein